MTGIGVWLSRTAERNSNKAAVICKNKRLTYKDLNNRVNRLANALTMLGVTRGCRVASLLQNCNEILELLFACAKIGAIFSPLNFRLSEEELAYIFDDIKASVVICDAEFNEIIENVLTGKPQISIITVGDQQRNQEYESFIYGAPDNEPCVEIDVRDTHMIMYSSGTTGHPKGVMLSHENTTWNIIQVLITETIMDTDSTLTITPMFHIAGLAILTLPLLFKGGTVIIEEKFDPDKVQEYIRNKQITCLFMVPSMWSRMIQATGFGECDLSTLRFCVSAGSNCPNSISRIFQNRGVPFLQAFGLTEVAPVAMLDTTNSGRKIGSVGKPSCCVEVKIVDNDGLSVPPENVGELIVRAPNVMKGYWNKPQETQNVFQGEWFRTGDYARVDEEGFLYVVCRKKDVIISGGENIYPVEVEKVLLRHENVQEAVVVGVEDALWGETVKAIVVLKNCIQVPTIEDIRSFCEGKLARFKMPKILEIVAELPRNANGKILKEKLRRVLV
ncbi:acyl-CoA synthetase [Sporomusa malonica]|uniref:Fatty-acyl-CoA synthase n=1 Tax=Sporomusa malonica TaxID=112901 RepID=A0A1W2F5V4_9FIRM|nr:long-chain fatty acid--CoA ligase [Sporomusa malonica]SMD17305.1 fatty-acyl-CoA synthase [Sporomusa malonica]